MSFTNHRRKFYGRRSIYNPFRKTYPRSSKRFKSVFERDLSAMNKVWRMLKEGTIRAFGEIGRQY
tara:strand:+ start:478 stop:672 length:195 start_codon:yes stop_codon:yes gene_type:complete